MENIFIYAGSRSAKLADYILIKNPKWFPSQVKYNVAIGRAIKTNWGRKSINLLAKQIEEKGKNNVDINRELGYFLKKYARPAVRTIIFSNLWMRILNSVLRVPIFKK